MLKQNPDMPELRPEQHRQPFYTDEKQSYLQLKSFSRVSHIQSRLFTELQAGHTRDSHCNHRLNATCLTLSLSSSQYTTKIHSAKAVEERKTNGNAWGRQNASNQLPASYKGITSFVWQSVSYLGNPKHCPAQVHGAARGGNIHSPSTCNTT